MNDVRGRVLAGTFFHAPARGTIEVLQDALLAVDETGTISTVTRRREPDYARLRSEAGEAGALLSISAGSYVLPGLIDLHIHAPQYPQLGKALDRSLEDWLARYTFPLGMSILPSHGAPTRRSLMISPPTAPRPP
jgi:guanine deaminase